MHRYRNLSKDQRWFFKIGTSGLRTFELAALKRVDVGKLFTSLKRVWSLPLLRSLVFVALSSFLAETTPILSWQTHPFKFCVFYKSAVSISDHFVHRLLRFHVWGLHTWPGYSNIAVTEVHAEGAWLNKELDYQSSWGLSVTSQCLIFLLDATNHVMVTLSARESPFSIKTMSGSLVGVSPATSSCRISVWWIRLVFTSLTRSILALPGFRILGFPQVSLHYCQNIFPLDALVNAPRLFGCDGG